MRLPGLAAIAALAVALPAALVGCGGDAETDKNSGTITMMAPLLLAQAPDSNGELQRAVEKLIGKKLDITWVPNADYGDRTNVTLASDKIPEVMVVQGKIPAFVQSAQAGAFWELTDRLDKYPNLKAENPQVELNSSINGKVYGIYRRRDPMRTAVIIRKDWLGKLGLQVPQTVDDLYQVAKAFTEKDPDGNGKKDTYGLVIPKWPGVYATASPYDVIETWFGAPNGWGERDGKLVPGFDTPQFLEADRFMKKMVDEGLINRDFATLDSGKWNEPFFNGKGGIIIDVSSRAVDGSSLPKLFEEKYPGRYGEFVTMTGNLRGPDGQLHAYPTVGYNGFLAISKQSVRTEKRLDEILSVLNKLNSKEGQVLLNNGIEGRNFKVEDGYAVPINSDDAAAKAVQNAVTAFAQIGTAVNGQLFYRGRPAGEAQRKLDEARVAFHASDLKSAVVNPAQALVSQTYATRGAQLDQIIADARIKYLAGQIDENGLRSEIKRWYSEGGQQIVDEMNELYAKVK